MRGKRVLLAFLCGIWGSPPHVRGKVVGCVELLLILGITPACAGKRPFIQHFRLGDMDHPRMCGEKGGCGLPRLARWGSPPHVRGKGHRTRQAVYKDRITPACAGKSFCPGVATNSIKGSPPHVRGKGVVHVFVPEKFGITPACAGKRLLPPSDDTREWDHPRMCGEKKERIWEQGYIQGSPPRMRGKGCLPALAFGHVGITPAYAGKRQHQGLCPQVGRDHPRMCGEKFR